MERDVAGRNVYVLVKMESNKWSVNGMRLNSHTVMYVLGEPRENISA